METHVLFFVAAMAAGLINSLAGGGLVGALIWTGDKSFLFLVPWLVLGGTVLFVLEPRPGPSGLHFGGD